MTAARDPFRTLAGTPLAADLIAPAEYLVEGIRDDDPDKVAAAVAAASAAAGDAYTGALGMACLLAAALDCEDVAFGDWLRWIADKATYRYARSQGLTHAHAVGWTLHVLDLAEDAEDGSATAAEAHARITEHRIRTDQHADEPPGHSSAERGRVVPLHTRRRRR